MLTAGNSFDDLLDDIEQEYVPHPSNPDNCMSNSHTGASLTLFTCREGDMDDFVQ